MGETGDDFCAFNFKPGAPVQITLTFPTGDKSRWTLCGPCRGAVDIMSPFMALPDYPIGLYHVRATQGSLSADGTFTLQRAPHPTLAVRENCVEYDGVQRGKVVHLGVSGFRDSQQVQLLLYYAKTRNGNAQFIASVPLVIDGNGSGLYTLATRSDDPPGYYAVRTIPSTDTTWHEAYFCIHLK
jgi:hypothetical protein